MGVEPRGARLAPPRLRRASLVRRRLLRLLDERFTAPVTVVVAPAGFGKTTLLAQAVAENRRHAADLRDVWLTCCADDAAGSSLIDGLCRALGVLSAGGPAAGIERLVEATWHRSPAEVVFLVDDVHEIAPDSPGTAALAQLVAAVPRNVHFVFAGRQPPPIALSRQEVLGQVVRIGESDLLFTDDELAAFASLREVPGRQLAGCGGWPALAELAASAVPSVAGDFLWEEVLDGIPEEARRELALLAHVGAVDDALATAVLGRAVDVAELTAHLPLVAATAAGGRQIHALWRPHVAKFVGPAEVAEARRRAGVALAGAGDPATAVRLLVDAGAWDDVTDVVVDVLGAAHPPVAGDLVAAWLGRLPDHLADGPLARLMGAVATVQTDPRSAARLLGEAADAFRAEGNPAGELACMAQLGQLAWWAEDPTTLARLMARLFELEVEGVTHAGPLACLARALVADLTANCDLVLAELDRIPAGSLSAVSQSMLDWLRASSLNHLGRLNEGRAAAEAALAHASPLIAPMVESTLLQAMWFAGRVDEVLDRMPALLDATAAIGQRDYTALLASTCCLAFAADGRLDEAERQLALARREAATPDTPLVDVNLAIATAAVAVARGDEAAAAQALDEHLGRAPGDVLTGLAAYPRQRSLVLWYVLVPSTRPAWDAADLGPCYEVARDLARRLVVARSGNPAALPDAPLPEPGVVRSAVPLRWITELALAHIDAGRQDGWGLLDAVWPRAQPDVRRHADAVPPGPGASPGPGPGPSLGRPARTALSRLPVPPAGRLELRLLGPVSLARDGRLTDAPEWRRERVRALLAHLTLHGAASRERLGEDLWPGLEPAAQSRNLRVTLTHLLRVLEPDRSERDAAFLVRSHGSGLLLRREGGYLDTDVWRFDALVRRASDADAAGNPSVALDAMEQAVALWRDDPVELSSHPWAVPEIEGRRLRLVEMATRAGELLLARSDPTRAVAMGEAALRGDPYVERAHRVVIAAHVGSSQHRAAGRAVDRYRDVLAELGTPPAEIDRELARLGRRSDAPSPPSGLITDLAG
jgi:DNA-binding SARP family transcriptional activator